MGNVKLAVSNDKNFFKTLKTVNIKALNRVVIPVKAGIHFLLKIFWIPACAGMTE